MNVVHKLLASIVSVALLAPLAGCGDWLWTCDSAAEIEVLDAETGKSASDVTVGYFLLGPAQKLEDVLPYLGDLWTFAVTDSQGIARLSLSVGLLGPPPWYPGYGLCDGPVAGSLLLLLPDSSEPVELSLEPGAVVATDRYTVRLLTVGAWSRVSP